MAGLAAAPSVHLSAAADAMLVIGSRLNEPTSWDDTIRQWRRAGHTSTSSRGGPQASDLRPYRRCRRTCVPAQRGDRLLGKAVLDAELVRRRRANNDRSPHGRWRRPSTQARTTGPVPASTRPRHRPAPCCPMTHPDDRCREFRRLGGRGFHSGGPAPSRPDLRGDGVRRPGRHSAALVHRDQAGRGARRRWRMAMTMAEPRRRTAGADHRPRLRQRALRDDPHERARRGTGEGIATELGSVFAAIRVVSGARRARRACSEVSPPSSGARGGALDGHPSAARSGVVSVDQPATADTGHGQGGFGHADRASRCPPIANGGSRRTRVRRSPVHAPLSAARLPCRCVAASRSSACRPPARPPTHRRGPRHAA
jgi:hypothetical protein